MLRFLPLSALLLPAVLVILAAATGAFTVAVAALALVLLAPLVPAPLAALARARGDDVPPGPGALLAIAGAQVALMLLLAVLAGGGGPLDLARRALALAATVAWLLGVAIPNARALGAAGFAAAHPAGLALLAALGATRLAQVPLAAHRHEHLFSYAARALLQDRAPARNSLAALALAVPWAVAGWAIAGVPGALAVLMLQSGGLALALLQGYLARYGLEEADAALAPHAQDARWHVPDRLGEALSLLALHLGLPEAAARTAIRARLDETAAPAPRYPAGGVSLALAALRGVPFFAMTDAVLRPDLAGAAPFDRLAPLSGRAADTPPERPALPPGTPLTAALSAEDAAILTRVGGAARG